MANDIGNYARHAKYWDWGGYDRSEEHEHWLKYAVSTSCPPTFVSVWASTTPSICKGVAELLAPRNIRVNCINPGCNDTGYMFGEAYDAITKNHPAGRWGTPDDTADLALFLHSTYGKWVTGQVIASHGGCKGEF